MKDVATYRFTISFQGTNDANVRVGELLKSLGHKKSEVIVTALNSYLDQRPELLFAGAPKDGKEQMNIAMLEKMIENMVMKKLEGMVATGKTSLGDNDNNISMKDIPEVVDDITHEVSAGAKEMFANLGSFFE